MANQIQKFTTGLVESINFTFHYLLGRTWNGVNSEGGKTDCFPGAYTATDLIENPDFSWVDELQTVYLQCVVEQ